MKLIKTLDTGDIWICPICKRKYHLLHRLQRDPQTGKEKILKHDFEEVT